MTPRDMSILASLVQAKNGLEGTPWTLEDLKLEPLAEETAKVILGMKSSNKEAKVLAESLRKWAEEADRGWRGCKCCR